VSGVLPLSPAEDEASSLALFQMEESRVKSSGRQAGRLQPLRVPLMAGPCERNHRARSQQLASDRSSNGVASTGGTEQLGASPARPARAHRRRSIDRWPRCSFDVPAVYCHVDSAGRLVGTSYSMLLCRQFSRCQPTS
jgi:hypothetical protein